MSSKSEYQKLWRRTNPEKSKAIRARSNHKITSARRRLLDSIKLERGCTDCGYNLAPEALHFDHREPKEKSFTISNSLTTSWEVILAEIAKCDVRCANCHAIRSKRLGHNRVG
jgi:predicted Zn-ribbon and HTH transcriptional regulator